MDLSTFSSQLNQFNKKSSKELLPTQQKTRSYKDIESIPISQQKLDITLDKYKFGEEKGEWQMQYYVRWPIQTGSELRKHATKQQYIQFANEFLEARSRDKNDLKYFSISRADDMKFIFVFEADNWVKDNFNTIRPRLKPPISLSFKFRNDVPLYLRTDAPPNDLGLFIGEKFKEWLLKNSHKLRNTFNFLKKITADLFEYKADIFLKEITATLKYSVILASLGAYMVYRHKKELKPAEAKSIQKNVSRFGDVKKLDKYLKRI